MSLLTRRDIIECIIHFVLVPVIVERVARYFFVRTHLKLKPEDRAVLSQRFTRAFIALNLVQGGVRALLFTKHAERFSQHFQTPIGQYYCLGTIIYYVFDTLLLAAQRSNFYDLWIHHLTAIFIFSYFLYNGVGESGGMCVLICEFLVPWGFQLFYYKLNNLRASPWFRVVCFGGIATLFGRISIWLFLLYQLNGPEYYDTSRAFWLISNPLFIVALSLDVYWLRLYFTNLNAFHTEREKLKGAPAPSVFSAISW